MIRLFHRFTGAISDAVLCSMMNRAQWRLRHLTCGKEEYFSYLDRCEPLDPRSFYAIDEDEKWRIRDHWIEGGSPDSAGDFLENTQFRARIFWKGNRPNPAPTVILLHALMSAHSGGYHRIAREFNEAGWNAVFPHLPYHYSRVPRGYANGVLALTSNLVRNGETLRRAVRECRMLMRCLRMNAGVEEFGLIGTSYGGWTGALVSSLEPGWRFVALVQPIGNVHRAIWENPVSRSMRRALGQRGIGPGPDLRHAHLSCPTRATPLVSPDRIVLMAGEYDTVAPVRDLRELAGHWNLPELVRVPQAHFGYRTMRETLKRVKQLR